MRVPVCVRDGEQTATISVAGIEFQMGIGELRQLFGSALMDIRNASIETRSALEKFLVLGSEVCGAACSLSTGGSDAEMEANRKRWEETGLGGVQDLEPLRKKLSSRVRAVDMKEFRERQREYADRGGVLFPEESREAAEAAKEMPDFKPDQKNWFFCDECQAVSYRHSCCGNISCTGFGCEECCQGPEGNDGPNGVIHEMIRDGTAPDRSTLPHRDEGLAEMIKKAALKKDSEL